MPEMAGRRRAMDSFIVLRGFNSAAIVFDDDECNDIENQMWDVVAEQNKCITVNAIIARGYVLKFGCARSPHHRNHCCALSCLFAHFVCVLFLFSLPCCGKMIVADGILMSSKDFFFLDVNVDEEKL